MTGSLKACLRLRTVLARRHENERRRQRRRRRKTRICTLSLATRRSLLLSSYLCLCLCPCLGVLSAPVRGDIAILRFKKKKAWRSLQTARKARSIPSAKKICVSFTTTASFVPAKWHVGKFDAKLGGIHEIIVMIWNVALGTSKKKIKPDAR